MKKYLFLIFAYMINIQCALSAEPAFGGDLDASLKTSSNVDSSIGTVIFALIFVVCLIYITGIIYTRLNTIGAKTVKKQIKSCKADNIIILSTMQLGQGKNLHVVETNGRKVLVGATATSINIIKDLGDDEDFLPKTPLKEAEILEKSDNIDNDKDIINNSDINSNVESINKKYENKNFDSELYKKYL